ncbi:MAG TPA: hypothetical protein VE758_02615 [Chthoniobacterales bacterium]|jgi:hypothetical protein|nr:hypothetical protein [Chthoniobacterales bacterium]
MKTQMRRKLAQQSFEEKIRKVSDLIRLSRRVKRERLRSSLKGTTAIDLFMSERHREREL